MKFQVLILSAINLCICENICACSMVRGRIKGAARSINAIKRTTVLYILVVRSYSMGMLINYLPAEHEELHCLGRDYAFTCLNGRRKPHVLQRPLATRALARLFFEAKAVPSFSTLLEKSQLGR